MIAHTHIEQNTKELSWLAACGHVCILMPARLKPSKTKKIHKEDVSKRHALRKKITEAEKTLLIGKIIEAYRSI